MPDWPINNAPGYLAQVVTASTVNSNASPNVKGAWAELCTSTPWDADAILFHLQINSNTAGCLMDFAIGAAGSEIVVAENVLIAQLSRLSTYFHLPKQIPAGTRIAARVQCTSGGQAVAIQAMIIRGSFWSNPPAGNVITYGAATSDSGGQAIDTGAVANTYTSWVQLSASTDRDISAVFLMVGNRQNASPTDQAGNFWLDIGYGAAASEVAVIAGLRFGSSASALYGPLPGIWLPVSIPAGSRLCARARSAVTDATDRVFDLTVYALT